MKGNTVKKTLAALAAALIVGGTVFGIAPAAFADDTLPVDPAVVQEVAPEAVSEATEAPATPSEAPAAPVVAVDPLPLVTPEVAAPVTEEAPVAAKFQNNEGEGHDPTTFCHKPGKHNQQELTTDDDGFLQGHLGHGDILGSCPAAPVILNETYSWLLATGDTKDSITKDQTLLGLGDIQPTVCGTTVQVDDYTGTREEIDAVIGDSILTWNIGGGTHEDFDIVKSWHFNVAAPCPTNVQCETFSDGGTSTNLDANGWFPYDTRSAGHADYVAGGLHIYTDDASSNAKIQWAKDVADFPLSQTGQISADYDSEFGLLPGVKLNVTFATGLSGTLVWEEVYGGQDLWLPDSNNAAIVAPQTGGGFGSFRHGTINEWLTVYPDAVVNAIQFGIGSGAYGGGVLHSISVGCATYDFDYIPPVVVTAQFDLSVGTPTCDVAGTFDTSLFPIDGEFYTLSVDRPFDGPGDYVVTATPKFNVVLEGDTSKTFTVLPATGYQSEDNEYPCYVEIVPQPEVPVFHDSCGVTDDAYSVPEDSEFVHYEVVEDGDTVTVTAVLIESSEEVRVALSEFEEGAVTEWSYTFTDEACPVTIVDVPKPPVTVAPLPLTLASTGVNNVMVLGYIAAGLFLFAGFLILIAKLRKRFDKPAAE